MKKAIGIIRKLDELGRIVIPMEMRKRLNIKIGDSLEILQIGNNIQISKSKTNICSKCGEILEEGYKYCPYCGKENNDTNN